MNRDQRNKPWCKSKKIRQLSTHDRQVLLRRELSLSLRDQDTVNDRQPPKVVLWTRNSSKECRTPNTVADSDSHHQVSHVIRRIILRIAGALVRFVDEMMIEEERMALPRAIEQSPAPLLTNQRAPVRLALTRVGPQIVCILLELLGVDEFIVDDHGRVIWPLNRGGK